LLLAVQHHHLRVLLPIKVLMLAYLLARVELQVAVMLISLVALAVQIEALAVAVRLDTRQMVLLALLVAGWAVILLALAVVV
jgi:hypothetical protein